MARPGGYVLPERWGGGPGVDPNKNREAIHAAVNEAHGSRVLISPGTWDVACNSAGSCIDMHKAGVRVEFQGKLRLVHPLATRTPPVAVIRVFAPRVHLQEPQIDGNRDQVPWNGLPGTQSLIQIRKPPTGPDAIDCRIEGGTLTSATTSAIMGGRSGLRVIGTRIVGVGEHAIYLSRDNVRDHIENVVIDGATILNVGLLGDGARRLPGSFVKMRGVRAATVRAGLYASGKAQDADTEDAGVVLSYCEGITVDSVTIQGVTMGLSLGSCDDVELRSCRVYCREHGALIYCATGTYYRRVRASKCFLRAKREGNDTRDRYTASDCVYDYQGR